MVCGCLLALGRHENRGAAGVLFRYSALVDNRSVGPLRERRSYSRMLHGAWTELIFLSRGYVMRMSPSK